MKMLAVLLILLMSAPSSLAYEIGTMDAESIAAAELERKADRHLDFSNFDSITVGRLPQTFTWEQLRPFLLEEKHKDLLVIRFPKGRWDASIIEQLRSAYRGLGYKRVVVLGSTAFSIPILADDFFYSEGDRHPHVVIVPAAYSPPYLMILPQGPLPEKGYQEDLDEHDSWLRESAKAYELERQADHRLYVDGIDSIKAERSNPKTGRLTFTREELRPLLQNQRRKNLLVIRLAKLSSNSDVATKIKSFYEGLGYKRVVLITSSAFGSGILADITEDSAPVNLREALNSLDVLPRHHDVFILPAACDPPYLMLLSPGQQTY
jgi:hypothetical protein